MGMVTSCHPPFLQTAHRAHLRHQQISSSHESAGMVRQVLAMCAWLGSEHYQLSVILVHGDH